LKVDENKLNELSSELGKAAIAQVCENARKPECPGFEVCFHGGGELTMAWQTLQECVAYARQRDLPAKISLTNKGIWSRQKAECLMDHLDDISLSMDRDPQTQDHSRPYVDGWRSSNILMRMIAELDRRRFRYGIRMTATAPWEDFPRNVRFLCEKTKVPSMQVEPAFNTRRGGHRQPDTNEELRFDEAFLEAFDIANRSGRRLSYSGARLGMLTSQFLLRTLPSTGCQCQWRAGLLLRDNQQPASPGRDFDHRQDKGWQSKGGCVYPQSTASKDG
jgi:uncharacterized protein